MKDWHGWAAFIIFAVACYVIGVNRYLMKSMNLTVLIMLAISIVLVVLLNSRKTTAAENDSPEFEDER